MSMYNVPLQPLPAQTLQVVLGDQQAVLTLRQLRTGLYINVAVDNNREIVGLVLCENLNRIVRDAYLGFQGDLFFYDTTGQRQNPDYAGLGSRYQLVWVDGADLEALES